MIEVVLHDKYAGKIIEIVHDLKSHGYVSGKDFEFAYHKAEFDWASQSRKYNRHTTFRFEDPAVATWFSLKYNS